MSTAEKTTKKSSPSRKKVRAEGRKKRTQKLKTDREFAKTYFAGKSKRAADKKSAFRKKKSKKK